MSLSNRLYLREHSLLIRKRSKDDLSLNEMVEDDAVQGFSGLNRTMMIIVCRAKQRVLQQAFTRFSKNTGVTHDFSPDLRMILSRKIPIEEYRTEFEIEVMWKWVVQNAAIDPTGIASTLVRCTRRSAVIEALQQIRLEKYNPGDAIIFQGNLPNPADGHFTVLSADSIQLMRLQDHVKHHRWDEANQLLDQAQHLATIGPPGGFGELATLTNVTRATSIRCIKTNSPHERDSGGHHIRNIGDEGSLASRSKGEIEEIEGAELLVLPAKELLDCLASRSRESRASLSEAVDFLRQSGLANRISPKDLFAAATCMKKRTLMCAEVLFCKGEPVQSVFFVVSGEIVLDIGEGIHDEGFEPFKNCMSEHCFSISSQSILGDEGLVYCGTDKNESFPFESTAVVASEVAVVFEVTGAGMQFLADRISFQKYCALAYKDRGRWMAPISYAEQINVYGNLNSLRKCISQLRPYRRKLTGNDVAKEIAKRDHEMKLRRLKKEQEAKEEEERKHQLEIEAAANAKQKHLKSSSSSSSSSNSKQLNSTGQKNKNNSNNPLSGGNSQVSISSLTSQHSNTTSHHHHQSKNQVSLSLKRIQKIQTKTNNSDLNIVGYSNGMLIQFDPSTQQHRRVVTGVALNHVIDMNKAAKKLKLQGIQAVAKESILFEEVARTQPPSYDFEAYSNIEKQLKTSIVRFQEHAYFGQGKEEYVNPINVSATMKALDCFMMDDNSFLSLSTTTLTLADDQGMKIEPKSESKLTPSLTSLSNNNSNNNNNNNNQLSLLNPTNPTTQFPSSKSPSSPSSPSSNSPHHKKKQPPSSQVSFPGDLGPGSIAGTDKSSLHSLLETPFEDSHYYESKLTIYYRTLDSRKTTTTTILPPTRSTFLASSANNNSQIFSPNSSSNKFNRGSVKIQSGAPIPVQLSLTKENLSKLTSPPLSSQQNKRGGTGNNSVPLLPSIPTTALLPPTQKPSISPSRPSSSGAISRPTTTRSNAKSGRTNEEEDDDVIISKLNLQFQGFQQQQQQQKLQQLQQQQQQGQGQTDKKQQSSSTAITTTTTTNSINSIIPIPNNTNRPTTSNSSRKMDASTQRQVAKRDIEALSQKKVEPLVRWFLRVLPPNIRRINSNNNQSLPTTTTTTITTITTSQFLSQTGSRSTPLDLSRRRTGIEFQDSKNAKEIIEIGKEAEEEDLIDLESPEGFLLALEKKEFPIRKSHLINKYGWNTRTLQHTNHGKLHLQQPSNPPPNNNNNNNNTSNISSSITTPLIKSKLLSSSSQSHQNQHHPKEQKKEKEEESQDRKFSLTIIDKNTMEKGKVNHQEGEIEEDGVSPLSPSDPVSSHKHKEINSSSSSSEIEKSRIRFFNNEQEEVEEEEEEDQEEVEVDGDSHEYADSVGGESSQYSNSEIDDLKSEIEIEQDEEEVVVNGLIKIDVSSEDQHSLPSQYQDSQDRKHSIQQPKSPSNNPLSSTALIVSTRIMTPSRSTPFTPTSHLNSSLTPFINDTPSQLTTDNGNGGSGGIHNSNMFDRSHPSSRVNSPNRPRTGGGGGSSQGKKKRMNEKDSIRREGSQAIQRYEDLMYSDLMHSTFDQGRKAAQEASRFKLLPTIALLDPEKKYQTLLGEPSIEGKNHILLSSLKKSYSYEGLKGSINDILTSTKPRSEHYSSSSTTTTTMKAKSSQSTRNTQRNDLIDEKKSLEESIDQRLERIVNDSMNYTLNLRHERLQASDLPLRDWQQFCIDRTLREKEQQRKVLPSISIPGMAFNGAAKGSNESSMSGKQGREDGGNKGGRWGGGGLAVIPSKTEMDSISGPSSYLTVFQHRSKQVRPPVTAPHSTLG